jgi:hypothetical protein
MKIKLAFLITNVLLSLTGCGALSSDRHLSSLRDRMVCEGKPPAYVDGYVDGCDSGRYLAGVKNSFYRKDSVRSDQDALYARGWQEGQINCRNEAIVEKQQQAVAGGCSDYAGNSNSDEVRRRRMEEAEMQEVWEQLKK